MGNSLTLKASSLSGSFKVLFAYCSVSLILILLNTIIRCLEDYGEFHISFYKLK